MTEILSPEQIARFRDCQPTSSNWPVSNAALTNRLEMVCDSHQALQEQLTTTLASLEQTLRDAVTKQQMADAYIRDVQKQLADKQQQSLDSDWDKVNELVAKLDTFLTVLTGGKVR